MKTFSLVAKEDNKSNNTKAYIKQALLDHGFVYDKIHPSLVITIGGDGTLLYAVHKYLDQLDEIQFLSIHTGRLGFFSDYTEDELELCVEHIIKDEVYELFESQLLEAKVKNQTIYALNEIRLENIMKTQTLHVNVDDEFFETFKGNGLCLSTQAGSSAYNRSLGGGVVDSGLSLLQLSEIAGIHDHRHHSLRVPYILKDDRKLSFASEDLFQHSFLCYDHKQLDLTGCSKVECKMSDKFVRFVRYRKYSYLKRVRNLY